MTPRIWLESSVVIPTNRVRAATSVRVSMLSKPFTRTARKNPTSASCARPSASFASVLFAAISSAAFAVTLPRWKASEFGPAPAPVRARARPGNARGGARRNARPFDHVTLTVGAGAFTAAANPLAVPFRPEASSRQQRARQPALGRRCHAKLAVWLMELWSKRRASRLASPRARGREPNSRHDLSGRARLLGIRSLGLMANRLFRAGLARRTQPDGSRRLALGHIKAPLQGAGATARRHRRSPAEPQWAALAGRGASRRARCRLATCIALSKAEVERKLATALIISWPVPRFASSDPPW